MSVEQDKIVRKILRERYYLNYNNLTRTNFYAAYWQRNQEIPWALLANHVSRNAGYQMTDIARYKKVFSMFNSGFILTPATWVSRLVVLIAEYGGHDTLDALFTLLECGNYLIFKDVYPPLRIYELAKNNFSNQNLYLELLQREEFKIDDFIKQKWYDFFQKGQQVQFAELWKYAWGYDSDIQKHSFALIVNEQNQIEDRIINYTENYYLKNHQIGSRVINSLIELAGKLGITRLCFPQSSYDLGKKRFNTVQKLHIYKVEGFTRLRDRIQAGKDMYAAIFNDGIGSEFMNQLINCSSVIHEGSRAAYNFRNYNHTDVLSITPGGKKYSPKLKLVYPSKATALPQYRHIAKYQPLKIKVDARPINQLTNWLNPLQRPATNTTLHDVTDSLVEIIY